MNEPVTVFDRKLLVERLRRKRKPEPNILTRTIAEELVERLNFVTRVFENVCLIGR